MCQWGFPQVMGHPRRGSFFGEGSACSCQSGIHPNSGLQEVHGVRISLGPIAGDAAVGGGWRNGGRDAQRT
jgi:hypothetical protein